MEILSVKNLTFSYPRCPSPAVKNISFGVEAGDFVAMCGATGSGKSTLLRLIKNEIAPLGEKSGEILLEGKSSADISAQESAQSIGFVAQRPEQQLVADKVWHELAFGLENMNIKTPQIRRRVAEMTSYFGIEQWFDKKVSELSGGQKQLLNLASVMVMQPKILLLDEPTAQLDPIAASDFLTTLKKLNTELGLTVIIAEHRLEEAIPLSNKLMIVEGGELLDCGETRAVCERNRSKSRIGEAMPAPVRLFSKTNVNAPCPLTVAQGRRFITENFSNAVKSMNFEDEKPCTTPVLELNDVWFRYSRDLPDVLRGTNLKVNEGEIHCILGGNGSGKTTALGVASGLLSPYIGSVKVFGKKIKKYSGQSLYDGCIAVLPQDVQTAFLHNTVADELRDIDYESLNLPYDLTALSAKHPYDLSGGEQQLLALAKVLSARPRILMLDEPTKGLDAYAKNKMIAVLNALKAGGITVVAVTHDAEFAAACADRCSLFFRGEIICTEAPQSFFCGNSFYTTAASRMTRGYYDGVVTVEHAAALCRRNRR